MFKPGYYTVRECKYRDVYKMQNGMNPIDLAKMACITSIFLVMEMHPHLRQSSGQIGRLAVCLQEMLLIRITQQGHSVRALSRNVSVALRMPPPNPATLKIIFLPGPGCPPSLHMV